MAEAEFRGLKRRVPVGAWTLVNHLAPLLYGLTDITMSEKESAKWAFDRAVSLADQLIAEARAAFRAVPGLRGWGMHSKHQLTEAQVLYLTDEGEVMKAVSDAFALIQNLRNAADDHKAKCRESCNVNLYRLRQAALILKRDAWPKESEELDGILHGWPT
jgi:hypothetical protein